MTDDQEFQLEYSKLSHSVMTHQVNMSALLKAYQGALDSGVGVTRLTLNLDGELVLEVTQIERQEYKVSAFTNAHPIDPDAVIMGPVQCYETDTPSDETIEKAWNASVVESPMTARESAENYLRVEHGQPAEAALAVECAPGSSSAVDGHI